MSIVWAQQAAPALSLREALRTIGHGLEARRARRLHLTVDDVGVTVEPPGVDGCRIYAWADLDRLSRAQLHSGRSHAGRPHGLAVWSLTRWSVLLRVAGQLLDSQGIRACRLEAAIGDAPHTCEVRAAVDERVVLESLAVRLHWLRLRTRFDGAGAELPRRSPAWWRWPRRP